MNIISEIGQWAPEIAQIRHDIHQHPEMGHEERRTAALVADKLRSWGITDITEGVGVTGVVAVIEGKRPGKRSIGLRADMDCLPLIDKCGEPWASQTPGQHHACGHDGHTATLLLVARYLAAHREDFAGRAVCVFQPAEEGRGGAQGMIEDGLFRRWPMDEIYCYHNWPGLPWDEAGYCPGEYQAAAGEVRIRVVGKGGHGARPMDANDPIIAAQNVITALQTIVSRNTDPFETAVITIGGFSAGDPMAPNVIPDAVTMTGTVRTFTQATKSLIEKRIDEICRGMAVAFGVQIDSEVVWETDVTYNRPDLCEAIAPALAETFGADKVHGNLGKRTGAEDFGWMMQQCPGVIVRIGNADERHPHSTHHPAFDFNDRILPGAASAMARIVLARLKA